MRENEAERQEKKTAINVYQDFNEILKLVAEKWVLIGGIGALISAVVSYGVLMTYSLAIGRIDLLPLLFDKKFSALLPWMGLVAFLLIVYMAVMFVATAFYSLSVSLFNEAPNLRPAVARIFFWHAVAGSLLFVGFAFKRPDMNHWLVAIVIVFCMAVMVGVSMRSKKLRVALKFVSLFNNLKARGVWWHQVGVFVFAYSILMLAIFSVAYPMSVFLKSYTGKDTPEAIESLMGISMIAVVLLFLPALIFFVSKKHVVIRAFLTSSSALIITLVVVAICPGVSSTLVYKAAEMVGVREMSSFKYRLLKNFEIKDFDKATWGDVDGSPDLPVVTAFPLFSLGDVLLLCPSSLNSTRLGGWPDHSHACILTQGSDVVKLPEVTTANKQSEEHERSTKTPT